MKRIILYILGFYLIVYSYLIPGNDEEFFINPHFNYEFNNIIKDKLEDYLFSGSFLMLSYGSLTSTELYKKEILVVNYEINEKWAFRAFYDNYEVRHLSNNIVNREFGFRYKIRPLIYITSDVNMEYEKEDTDLSVGILLKGEKNYCQLKFIYDDIIYDQKNTSEGITKEYPYGSSIYLKYNYSLFSFFADIKVSNGFEREFPDDSLKSDVSFHAKKINNYKFRLKSRLSDSVVIVNELLINKFYEKKMYNDFLNTYSDFKNDFYKFDTNVDVLLNKDHINVGLTYILSSQKYVAPTPDNYSLKLESLIPYIIYSYEFNKSFVIEPSYSIQINLQGNLEREWNSVDLDLFELEYNDMLKLGVRYQFNEKTNFYFSIAHLINSSKFGGGNVRFIATF